MLALVLMAATIEVRRDGPQVTLEQARAMAPAALGDALLAPGHPPIVEASVGPEGMAPPSAPGMPVTSEIRLFTSARTAARAGFCEKTLVTVTLAPVMRIGRDVPPARAQAVASTTLYRWAPRIDGRLSCEGRRDDFFALDAALGERSFAVIRALATVRPNQVRTIGIDDQDARSMRDYVRSHPTEAVGLPAEAVTPITDGRIALARFPISSITMIGRYGRGWNDRVLSDSDLRNKTGRALEAVTIFAGGVWTAGVVLDGDTITTIRFVKAIPPPF